VRLSLKTVIITVISVLTLGSSAATAGPMLKIGTEESSYYRDAEIVTAPKPEIPAELHEQCFKSCCLARFIIKQDGKSSVKLLSSTGSAEVDEIAVSTLQRWKFKPATVNGKPVESAKKIKVEFEVEE
jgi:TonB family protein